VEIEITETTVADNIRKIADILYSLRKRGIRIAVDDFGTGQSSLQYLCELPVDTLKIDKVFTQSMLTNSASEAIIRSAILLGHELKLLLVAEGIETQEQLEHLKILGCDIGQGYFLAKPMPVELATEWLMTKSAGIS
jgi:EAL domain-containing protein (putative c-di-GMP-specific phosphodiesterase class I)